MATVRVYPAGMQAAFRGLFDLLTTNVTAVMCDNRYVWDPAHASWSQISATCGDVGWIPVWGKTWEIEGTSVVLRADPLEVGAGNTFRSLILKTGTGHLISAVDMGVDVTTDGNPLAMPDGVFRIDQVGTP